MTNPITAITEPAWSQYGANAGMTFYLDVEPIRTQPRVVWTETLKGSTLLSSAQAVIAIGSGIAEFVDPANGASLSRPRGSEAYGRARTTLAGAALLVPRRDGVHAFDVPSGTKLWKFDVASLDEFVWIPGMIATSKGRTISAWAWSGVAEPSRTPIWEFTFPDGNEVFGLFAAGTLVVACQRLGDTMALDKASGKICWRMPGRVQMLDAHGAIIHGEEWRWTVVGVDGGERCANEMRFIPRALGPAHIVSASGFGPGKSTIDVSLVDRASGAVSRLTTVNGTELACAMARDVLYVLVEKDTLCAFSLSGGELWRLKIPRLTWPINEISAAPGRLYGATGNGRSFCLA